MKTKHELQKAAEAGLSTVDGLTVQPSASHDSTTSVSNEKTNSSELPYLEINSSFTEAVDAQEVNTTFTSAICGAHTTCETEDTSVFCKAVEIEGTKNIAKSTGIVDQKILSEPVNEEVNIFKATENGKIITFSKLVEAEETNANSMPVDTEQANTALIPVNAQEVNIPSEPDNRRETNNAASMLDDSEQTCATSMSVDAEETDTILMPIDAEETDTILIPVNDTVTDATSMPVDVKETGATSMLVDAEETDTILMLVDTEETNTSLSVEVE
jgi:hypothetical protein